VLGSQLDAKGPEDPVALLIERMPGTTLIPLEPDTGRLRTLGRMAALVHRVPLRATTTLPLRERHTSWTDYSTWRRWARRYRAESPSRRESVLGDFVTANPGWSTAAARETFDSIDSTPLLDEADDRVQTTRIRKRSTVFVHGDLWQGNTLWDGDRCTAVIDWEAAGAGHPGVDLGCLRWDAALKYGDAADVDAITDGWEEIMQTAATDVAYWDAVAALNVPADLGGFVQSMTEHGRDDLDGPTLTANNSAFLESALARL
jgi:aminoglycoside phosphotransferase (APT) family kinase protein